MLAAMCPDDATRDGSDTAPGRLEKGEDPMSTTVPAPGVRDLRPVWRRALAVIMPIPAALIAAEMVLTPYGLFATPGEQLAAATADPGRLDLVNWLVLVSLILAVPAAMSAAWVIRRSAPRLALAGGLLTIVGFAMSIAVPSTELLSSAAVRAGTDAATFEKVARAIEGHSMTGPVTLIFLVGQAVGLLLLGLGLWRTVGAPRWTAVALAASGALHIALSFNGIASAAAWGLTAAGFAGASAALLRQGDDEFDLPPTGVDVHPQRAAVSSGPGDVRRVWQWLLGLTAPLAAVAIAVLRFALPYDTPDGTDEAYAGMIAAPTFTSAQMWFGLLTPVVLSGVLAVLWVVRRRVPMLATVAAVLTVPGYLALLAADSVSPVLVDLVAHGQLDADAARPIALAVQAMPQADAAISAFVLGHLLGTILLGIALWRSRALPAWVGILLAVSQPVHLVAAMTGNHPLDLAAWGATALCMGLAGAAVVRMTPDEFDLPPRAFAPPPARVTAALPAHG